MINGFMGLGTMEEIDSKWAQMLKVKKLIYIFVVVLVICLYTIKIHQTVHLNLMNSLHIHYILIKK